MKNLFIKLLFSISVTSFILPYIAYGQLADREITALPIEIPRLLKEKDTVVISFIGDVMQHGKQLKSALSPGEDPDSADSYDYSHVFKYIGEQIGNSDITVANMEFPVGVPPYSGYPEFSAPVSIAEEAVKSGIDLFLIANNHLLDKGEKGIRRTIELYDSLGVNYTGAYRDSLEEKSDNPKILVVNGVKIAFLNFTYGTNGFPVPEPYVVNEMDSIEVKKAIRRGFERGAEIIIALPHWGEEYQLYPNEEQKKWAEMLKREGVRVIIGGHPHVPQTGEIEYAEESLPQEKAIKNIVFYSLGNYISNQSEPDYTQLELLVTITLVRDNISGAIGLLPPKYEYLWCFKAGEFEKDYTVVPIDYFKNNPKAHKKVRHGQYGRMVKTYEYVKNLNLYKGLSHE